MDVNGNAAATTWDVVVTVKAPEPYIAEFIERYRRLGASTIHIFYDDPALSFSFGGADLIETICGTEYWNGLRLRAVEKRQIHNATLAARASKSDWILHCDIDEHLHSDRQVSQVLAEVPETCGCYTARPVEAIFTQRPTTLTDIFSTPYFKSTRANWKASSAFWSTVYGDLISLSLAGFWGHRIGKSFIRCSRLNELASMPIHMPMGPSYQKMAPIKSKEIVLCHYDALLPDDWIRKHTDRVTGKVKAVWAGDHRNKQSRLVADAFAQGGLAGALELYDKMFVIDPASLDAGAKIGVVKIVNPDRPGPQEA